MSKVLVTGFGPFAGVPNNPTGEALSLLPSSLISNPLPCSHAGATSGPLGVINDTESIDVRICTEKLEVSSIGSKLISNCLNDGLRWHSILHFGVDPKATKPRIEMYAKNQLDFKQADNRGRKKTGLCIKGAPQRISLSRKFEKLAAIASEEWEYSDNIGNYICNETFFYTLNTIRKLNLKIPAGFFHVPLYSPEKISEWMKYWIERSVRLSRIIVSCIILRRSDGCIFSAHRKEYSSDDGWEFPGGKRRVGESIEKAAKREVLEELGINIESCSPYGVVITRKENYEIELHVFEASCDIEPVLGEGHDAFCWLSQEELNNVPWLSPDLPIVSALKRGITSLEHF